MVPVPWLLAQRWSRLLFAHWPVEPAELARRLPTGVEPDVRDGRAWLAIVAFRMLDTRPLVPPRRPTLPPIPELNVRTYVRVGGVPGVWFLTLDASSPFFVNAGRTLYGLPYRLARMTTLLDGERTHYLSTRRDACFAAAYEPCGPAARAEARSLEHFLVERYRLFSMRRGRLITAVVDHEPWPLQPAAARLDVNRMAPTGLSFAGEPILHYAGFVEARISAPCCVSQLESHGWWPWQGYASRLSRRRSRQAVPQRA
jgi:uncharacterized protein YqjF (DUF2071 family)